MSSGTPASGEVRSTSGLPPHHVIRLARHAICQPSGVRTSRSSYQPVDFEHRAARHLAHEHPADIAQAGRGIAIDHDLVVAGEMLGRLERRVDRVERGLQRLDPGERRRAAEIDRDVGREHLVEQRQLQRVHRDRVKVHDVGDGDEIFGGHRLSPSMVSMRLGPARAGRQSRAAIAPRRASGCAPTKQAGPAKRKRRAPRRRVRA